MLFDFAAEAGHYRVKSPLNYIGGKYRLLSQIVPLIPKDIRTLVDVFCGGFNLGANVNAQQVIGIDLDRDVIGLLTWMRDNPPNTEITAIRDLVRAYKLGRPAEHEEAYYALRAAYNEARRAGASELDGHPLPLVLFTLICHAFNNYIRFRRNGFNLPFGRRTFNKHLSRNLREFSERLQAIHPRFEIEPYTFVETLDLGPADYVYLDPPYLITTAPYNEILGWREDDERTLCNMLDRLHARGVRFGLSNVIESRGKTNEILKDWSVKYTVHDLDMTYEKASWNLKDGGEAPTREVFVTNC